MLWAQHKNTLHGRLMPFDTSGIRRAVTIVEAAARFGVPLKANGREWRGCCPFHSEKTASFTVFSGKAEGQRFYCFGCGEAGDVIDFTMQLKGVNLPDACEILGGKKDVPDNRPAVVMKTEDPYEGWQAVDPGGKHPFMVGTRTRLYNPKSNLTSSFKPELVHEYRDQAGELYGVVIRRPAMDGKGGKEYAQVQLISREPGVKEAVWGRLPFEKSGEVLPYRVQDIGAAQQVIIVEGEKCADKLRDASQGTRVVLAWPSGGGNWDTVNWEAIAGRAVVLWADYDEPGSKAMRLLADKLSTICSSVAIIDRWAREPVSDLPKGWDVADAVDDGWTMDQILAYARQWREAWQGSGDVPATTAPAPAPASPEPSQAIAVRPAKVTLHKDEVWKTQLIINDKGVSPKSPTNWMLFLGHHQAWEGVFRLNAFTDVVMVMRAPPYDANGTGYPRNLRDTDITETALWFEQLWNGAAPKDGSLLAVIEVAALKAKFDPLIDYLDGLTWDGTPRVARWFHTYMRTEDSQYNSMIGQMHLISAIARARQPGCKVDTMPVFEGTQGYKKSTGWKALYGPTYFTDVMPDISTKDALMSIHGIWCMEIAEMHRIGKANSDAVKSFMSSSEDRYRPPYGRLMKVSQRRSVLVGTINADGAGYLNDPTGNRRFWPTKVDGTAYQDLIERDRDQLWAEAQVMYRAGVPWWIDEDSDVNKRLFKPQQQARTQGDPWVNALLGVCAGREVVSLSEAMVAVGVDIDRQDLRVASRLSTVMKQLGYTRARSKDGYDCFAK